VRINPSKRDRLITLPRMKRENPPTHLIRSTRGDYLRARLVSMDEKTATVEVHLETRRLPREHLTRVIWLHPDDAEAANDATGTADVSTAATRVQAVRENGTRLTFFPEELAGSTLHGHSEVLGTCRVKLAEVDQLVLGAAIDAQRGELPYQRWVLRPAIDPRYVSEGDGQGEGPAGTESTLVGQPAPDVELPMLDGEEFRLRDQRGKIVVLDFWASWCGPCIQLMPEIDRVVGQYDPKDVLLVAVNLEETPEAVNATLERLGLKTTVALDRDGVVAHHYAAVAIPQTVIVDRAGKVARVFIGGGPQYVQQLGEALREMTTAGAEQ
jgi:thiol-disulfide isomerase/thioredoxin